MKKRLLVKESSPDMILAEDVYTIGGQIILPKGKVLTNRDITRMRFYCISDIVIEIQNEAVASVDKHYTDVLETEELHRVKAKENEEINKSQNEEYIKIIRNTEEYSKFNKNVYESALVLEDSLSTFIKKAGQDLITNELLNKTKEIIAINKNPMNTFHMLQNMRQYDDATFIHSLNVAIICNIFGNWINMPQEDLDILTLAGLLHDVGKMKIPENIIKKPEILTAEEYSVIKMHPKRGYNLLENMRIDQRIKNVALMHHERCDGSGYPDGLKGDKIDEFAKIVSIADIFDAMTSARVYRGPICPFEVINLIEMEGYQKFEPKYIIPFIEGIVNSYLNSRVLLSDGREGVIVLNNKNALSRPVIRVGEELVDLSEEPLIFIKEIL